MQRDFLDPITATRLQRLHGDDAVEVVLRRSESRTKTPRPCDTLGLQNR